jgi:hypothetical protein
MKEMDGSSVSKRVPRVGDRRCGRFKKEVLLFPACLFIPAPTTSYQVTG